MATQAVSPDYLRLIRRYPLRPIRSEEELDRAIAVVNSLVTRMDALGPDERDYLDVLSDLVEKFETETYPEPDVPPHEMLREMIAFRGVTQAEVAHATDIRESYLSEILSGKRKMGRKMIGTFARYFDVEPGVFFPDEVATDGG
jgi:HTH-type transcriptional regulator/antitoxin HigA